MTGLDVVVTYHAMLRARQRQRFPRSLTWTEVATLIAVEVQRAFEDGRVARVLPEWASRFDDGGSKSHCRPGTAFVWDITQDRGWIVVDEDDATVVITSLARPAAEGEAAA